MKKLDSMGTVADNKVTAGGTGGDEQEVVRWLRQIRLLWCRCTPMGL